MAIHGAYGKVGPSWRYNEVSGIVMVIIAKWGHHGDMTKYVMTCIHGAYGKVGPSWRYDELCDVFMVIMARWENRGGMERWD